MCPWAEDPVFRAPLTFDQDRRAYLRAEIIFKQKYELTRDEPRYVLDPQDIKGEDYPSETFRGLKIKKFSNTANIELNALS